MFGLSGLLAVPLVAAILSVFTNIFSILTPIFQGISRLFVWFVETFIGGLKSIANNLNTLAVILVLCLYCLHYGQRLDNDKITQEFRQDVRILEQAFKNKKTKDAKLPPKVNGHYREPTKFSSWLKR